MLSLFLKCSLGSPTERDYVLQTEYGIPVHDVPLTGTGRIKTKNLNSWIKFRMKKDETLKAGLPFYGIDCPDMKSIAIRNGGIMFHHPPNKAFRSYLKDMEETRERARKNAEKQNVITEIIAEVRSKGFEYVRWDGSEGYFVPVTDPNDIRTFVATSLRDQMKRSKAKKNVVSLGSPEGPHQKRFKET
jgi:hypothetical protein